MVKTQVQEIEPNKVSLQVEVGKEFVAAAFSNFFQQASQTVKIPGFRKGKVPRPVLVKFIGADSIRDEISEKLIHDAYPKALKEAKLHPVSPIKIEETNLKEGEPFTFKAVLEIRPTLPQFNFQGRKAMVQRAVVDDQSVGNVLQKLREQFGKLTPIEDGTLEFGDYFSGNIEVSCEGQVDPEASEEKAYRKFVEENTALIPMKGMKPGETRTFSNTLNREEDKDSSYYGKTLDYKVTVERISRLVLSELNDEFAKEVGEFGSLDELKTKIRNDLEERFKGDADNRAVDKILEEISAETTFSLPESMIQSTIDFFIQNLDRRWRQFGTSLEDYLKKSNKNMEEFRQGFREKAIHETRILLIVDSISEREKIDVLDSEYRKEVEKRAKEHGVAVEKLLSYLAEGDGEDHIRSSLVRNKVHEFLLKNNEIHYDMVSEQEINKGEPHGDSGTHSS